MESPLPSLHDAHGKKNGEVLRYAFLGNLQERCKSRDIRPFAPVKLREDLEAPAVGQCP